MTINKKKLNGSEIDLPVEYQDIPQVENHSYLAYLNSQARNLGLSDAFEEVTPVKPDNGEVFLSEYFVEQNQRNATTGQDAKTHLCLCSSCLSFTNDLRRNRSETVSVSRERDELVSTQQQPQMILPTVPPVTNMAISPRILQAPAPLLARTPLVVDNRHLSNGWLSIPSSCCFPGPPFYCVNRLEYFGRKNSGQRVLGRPPNHHMCCPARK